MQLLQLLHLSQSLYSIVKAGEISEITEFCIVLFVLLGRWYINITITTPDIIHRPVLLSYLKRNSSIEVCP
jgi:hypothetical protein